MTAFLAQLEFRIIFHLTASIIFSYCYSSHLSFYHQPKLSECYSVLTFCLVSIILFIFPQFTCK